MSERPRRRSVGTMLPRAGPRECTSTGRSISDLVTRRVESLTTITKRAVRQGARTNVKSRLHDETRCHTAVPATKHLWTIFSPIINRPKTPVNPLICSEAFVSICDNIYNRVTTCNTRRGLCLARSYPRLDLLPGQTFQAYVQPHMSTTTLPY